MSQDLITYIETMHSKLMRASDGAHEKLAAFEARVRAERDDLKRHIDQAADAIEQARMDVIAHAEERFCLPRTIGVYDVRQRPVAVVNQEMDYLFQGATH